MAANPCCSVKTETGAQLFSRLGTRPYIENLETSLASPISFGSVVEIFGDAGSGKSELLYHFVARCIFPFSWKTLQLDGLDVGVVFMDNDYHFDIFRLIRILERRINILVEQDRSLTLSNTDITHFVIDRLRMLYVLKCSNSEQFIVTLHSLENTLALNSKIACMMIDSMSAFYWIDHMSHQKLNDHWDKIVSLLEKLIQAYELTVIATKQNLVKNSSYNSDYDYLGLSWQKFVTHRLELTLERHEQLRTIVGLKHNFKQSTESKKIFITEAGVEFM